MLVTCGPSTSPGLRLAAWIADAYCGAVPGSGTGTSTGVIPAAFNAVWANSDACWPAELSVRTSATRLACSTVAANLAPVGDVLVRAGKYEYTFAVV